MTELTAAGCGGSSGGGDRVSPPPMPPPSGGNIRTGATFARDVSPGNYFAEDNTPITADDLWATVGTGGVIVDVTGTDTGDTALLAREFRLEME